MILSALTLPFLTIDPVIVQLGPLVIRWYGLAYVAGILLGWKWMHRLIQRSPFLGHIKEAEIDQFITWAIMGIVLGGRLGYVLFYTPYLVWEDPLRILQVWEGGMSFHGGLLGFGVALKIFTQKHKLSLLRFMDLTASCAPIGIFFGRIANFINAELFGRTTDVPWGMVFPNAGPLPRHPSQLYEAILEGLVLFILCNTCLRKPAFQHTPGRITGLFLAGYALFRTMVECVREPDGHLGYYLEVLTWGQILTIPMFVGGVYLLMRKEQP
jgi:phosphatidylglycerol:prolipoprotein diacylglycerol transferase